MELFHSNVTLMDVSSLVLSTINQISSNLT